MEEIWIDFRDELDPQRLGPTWLPGTWRHMHGSIRSSVGGVLDSFSMEASGGTKYLVKLEYRTRDGCTVLFVEDLQKFVLAEDILKKKIERDDLKSVKKKTP